MHNAEFIIKATAGFGSAGIFINYALMRTTLDVGRYTMDVGRFTYRCIWRVMAAARRQASYLQYGGPYAFVGALISRLKTR